MPRTTHTPLSADLRAKSLMVLLLVALLAGCASPPIKPLPDSYGPTTKHTPPNTSDLEAQLWAQVNQWEGTPHKLGGTDRSGVDCSGFVQRVYHDLFGIQLPRTTSDQVRRGEKINTGSLQSGDLVFFKHSRTGRHVGIYLSAGRFAHASKTKGVMISSLDEPYWRRTYWTARRVLPERL